MKGSPLSAQLAGSCLAWRMSCSELCRERQKSTKSGEKNLHLFSLQTSYMIMGETILVQKLLLLSRFVFTLAVNFISHLCAHLYNLAATPVSRISFFPSAQRFTSPSPFNSPATPIAILAYYIHYPLQLIPNTNSPQASQFLTTSSSPRSFILGSSKDNKHCIKPTLSYIRNTNHLL